MPRISEKGRDFYHKHGWNDKDIDYLMTNADEFEEGEQWIMGIARASDGVVWLYPTSPGNIFPVSLWKRIKWYIENNDNVVIPISTNLDKVMKAAKRYNGYLNDNLYMFGEQLKGVKLYDGAKKWMHEVSLDGLQTI